MRTAGKFYSYCIACFIGNSNPTPGILTNDELNFISSDHNQAGQQGRTPIATTEAINSMINHPKFDLVNDAS